MWLPLLVVLGLIFLYRWYRQSLILDNLAGKYVFITGCDTGFGNILARNLDKRGIRVLAACLRETGAESLKKETSSRLQTVILNVTDSESVRSAAKWVSSIVGEQGLWGLVNNAGVSVPCSPDEWLTKEDYSKVIDINLLGMIDVTINFLPFLRKARGRLVNMSSSVGRLTMTVGPYSLSKYAVESFSDSIRRQMRFFGVKVAIIEPGAFDTQITNIDATRGDLMRTWKTAPEEVKKSYGEDYYKYALKAAEQVKHLVNKNVNSGPTSRRARSDRCSSMDTIFCRPGC